MGNKFGADFLAYEGDPLTCHAKFLVIVKEDSVISQQELVLAERMANTVKKDLLIAFNSSQKICYCKVTF